MVKFAASILVAAAFVAVAHAAPRGLSDLDLSKREIPFDLGDLSARDERDLLERDFEELEARGSILTQLTGLSDKLKAIEIQKKAAAKAKAIADGLAQPRDSEEVAQDIDISIIQQKAAAKAKAIADGLISPRASEEVAIDLSVIQQKAAAKAKAIADGLISPRASEEVAIDSSVIKKKTAAKGKAIADGAL